MTRTQLDRGHLLHIHRAGKFTNTECGFRYPFVFRPAGFIFNTVLIHPVINN